MRDTPGASLLDYGPDGKSKIRSIKRIKINTSSSSFPTLNKCPNLRNGVLHEPLGSRVKRLSALRPSATIKNSLEAGGASGMDWGVMPWTRGDVK